MIEELHRRAKAKASRILLFSVVALFAAAIVNLQSGTVSIPASEVLKALFGGGANEVWNTIIIDFRLPRLTTAIIVGIGLSISGLLMQTLFRNSLAGPFVLGISSGASFGVALLLMGSTLIPVLASGLNIAFAATLGALSVLLSVLGLAGKVRDSTSLLILGLMLGSAVGACVSILHYFSNAEQTQNYLFWTFGSLSGVTWTELKIMVPVVLTCSLIAFLIARPLDLLNLGETYAKSSGLQIIRMRYLIILITSLSTGVITAFCGPVAFIGIAVPHIARLMLNSTHHKNLIIHSVFTGAIVLVLCDMITRIPVQGQQIPINAVTSIFGAPLIIWLILHRKRVMTDA